MKNFNKNVFIDFLELTKNKPLNKDEMDQYINGFCEYMHDYIDTRDNELSKCNKKELDQTKKKKFKLALKIVPNTIFILILVFLFICQIEKLSVLFIAFFILVMGITIFDFVNDVFGCYIHYRNTRKIKVGHTYIYDMNGLKKSCRITDMYGNKDRIDAVRKLSSPVILAVTNISKEAIYCVDLIDGYSYKMPLDESEYLTCISDFDISARNFVIRYPYKLPIFTPTDAKLMEACLIIAHHENNPELYKEIAGLLAKMRFYVNEPYGYFDDEKRQRYDQDIANITKLLDEARNGQFDMDEYHSYSPENDYQEEDDSFEFDPDTFDPEDN